MPKPRMTIIGFGRMGRKFASLFASEFDVRVSSTRDIREEVHQLGCSIAYDRKMSVSESNYVFLAVPVAALPAIVEELNAQESEDMVVMDCCSSRMRAEQELGRLKYRHFGLHDIRNGEFCITGDIDEGMKGFFRRKGIALRDISPEEHDKINAVIGLGHFVGLVLSELLTDEEKEILTGVGSGSWLVGLMRHLQRNSYTTLRETQIDNPFTEEQRKRLIEACQQYDKALQAGTFPFEANSEQSANR